MLDILLKLPRGQRNAIISEIKIEARREMFDNIHTMTEELGLDDVPDYETRVKMREDLIMESPHQVFWDFAEYATPNSGRAIGEIPDFEQFRFCKVSTRGEVVICNKINRLYIYVPEPRERYFSIKLDWKSKLQHRLIASTFITRPERLRDIPYRQLEVNHMDGRRWCNNIYNLEWTSKKENQRHCQGIERYDEEKYFLFKVMADNGFKDRKFVLSENELYKVGLDFGEANKYTIKYNSFKGFIVTQINHEDIEDIENIPIGFPTDIEELFNLDNRYFNIKIMPVIGTVLRGKYKGMEFSLFGSAEISRYFNRASVEAIARGKLLTHHGCTFRRVTHKEAIPLHGKFTKEIADDAYQSRKNE